MAAKREDLSPQNDYGDGISWARGPLLGKGFFGRVYKATLKEGGSAYSSLPAEMAVKSADVSHSGTLQKEKQIMTDLEACSNVIQCFGDELTQGDHGSTAYNLLLEYAAGGTLAERIKQSGGNGLPELEVKMHTRSLLRGLNHIHMTGYVHCDLKPTNILLVPRPGTNPTEFKAKIGDFGLAKRAKLSNCKKRKSGEAYYWRGTPMYLSPEAVTGNEQEAASDIWALGCVVLRMLTGKAPWEGRDTEEILAKIRTESEIPKIPKNALGHARDFLRCCFERKSVYRLTAELLLEHPFLDGLGSDYDYGVDETEECESVAFESDSDEDDDELSCDDGTNSDTFSSGVEEDADGTSDKLPCGAEAEKKVPSGGVWGNEQHWAVGNITKSLVPAVNLMRSLVIVNGNY